MKKNLILRTWEAAALIALCIALCLGAWAQGEHRQLHDTVLRLHVLAVSNSEYEQQLKLRVRDSVLQYMEPMLKNAGDTGNAELIIRENLRSIADAAYAAAEGRQVTVSMGEEDYPSRSYEGGSLPAGRYKSLKIILGEGEGQNWWCVVFPVLSGDKHSGEKLEIVSDERVFKFKLLELWGELTN